jgi:hypothetical protein
MKLCFPRSYHSTLIVAKIRVLRIALISACHQSYKSRFLLFTDLLTVFDWSHAYNFNRETNVRGYIAQSTEKIKFTSHHGYYLVILIYGIYSFIFDLLNLIWDSFATPDIKRCYPLVTISSFLLHGGSEKSRLIWHQCDFLTASFFRC